MFVHIFPMKEFFVHTPDLTWAVFRLVGFSLALSGDNTHRASKRKKSLVSYVEHTIFTNKI